MMSLPPRRALGVNGYNHEVATAAPDKRSRVRFGSPIRRVWDSSSASPGSSSRLATVDETRIVMACDLAYAMPLATMLRSLADQNAALWPLPVTVLQEGFTAQDMKRVADSLSQGSVALTWIAIDLHQFDEFPVLEHVSRMTYARLLMPRWLPRSVKRVLYLDVDMLVLGSIEALLYTPLSKNPVAAVTDLHVDGDLKSRDRARNPGVPCVAKYFNAGVMLFDLEHCAQQKIFERALAYLQTHATTPYSDQDALNVACDGLWQHLDGHWNFQGHHTCRIDRLPMDRRPAIVHFITSTKPWKPSSASINAALYDSVRSRTCFGCTPSQRLWAGLLTLCHRGRNRWKRITARPHMEGQCSWSDQAHGGLK
jgi:lipopolysaccharide biosynthesis glycosyltransferase